MTEMPDAAKMADLAKKAQEALYTLQNEFTGVKQMSAETKQQLLAHLNKYQDEIADTVAKNAAALNKADADHKAQVAELEKGLATLKKGTEEYDARVKGLELIIATKGRNGTDPEIARQTAEYKNFFGWLAYHPTKADSRDLDLKTLRTDSETQGAYLIPQIMDNEIRKNITEISPVRGFARVRMSPGKSMDIPRRLALLRAYFEGEGESGETDQSIYGSEQVTLYRQTITVPATLDMMVSSAFDIEREIASDVGESFGKGEGLNFLKGSGNKGPQGMIADSRIELHTTATSGDIDFIDMANCAGKLKSGQSPWWFFNRRTLAKMWSIKSTIGVPIWQPVAGNTPATIWGFPYNSDMIDLDDAQTGSNAKPIIFGDMRRGYEIFDMIGISVIRDDLTRKKEAITEWTFRRYLTGRVIVPEALKIVKVL